MAAQPIRPSVMQSISVFIGSSCEARDVAEAVASVLGGSFRCTPWWDVFPPSTFTLEALETARRQYQFAVFVVRADDVLARRGTLDAVVRDNVLGEFLMFVGGNGRDHTYLFLDTCKKPVLPSDLDGIVYATFDSDEFHRNPSGAISAGCDEIARRIYQVREQDVQRRLELERVALAEKNTSHLADLADAAFLLRDIIDAVQRDTLEALLDENRFAAIKSAAVKKIDEVWQPHEQKARSAGVIDEFTRLNEAVLTTVAALPFGAES